MKMKLSAIAMLLMASLAYGQSATPNTAPKAPAGSKTSAATKSVSKTATTKATTTTKSATAKATSAKAATAKATTAKPATARATTAKAAKPAALPAKAKPAHSPMAAKPAAKAVHHTAPKPAPATAATTSSAAAPAPNPAAEAARKRDPFVNPVQAVREGRGDACQGGKRCLAANEIVLRGIVKAQNGMIAVVESSAQRTYFLRENDAIYNGFVQKITPDTVTFREHFTDNLGRDAQRDIVKTVNAPVV